MKSKTNNTRFIIKNTCKKIMVGMTVSSLLMSGSISTVFAEEIMVDESAFEDSNGEGENTVENSAMTQVADEDYPNLVSGEQSKADLEYILSILPWYMNENGWEDYDLFLPYLINEYVENALHIENSPIAVLGQNTWSASDLTRLCSSFSSLVFSEENITEVQSIIGNATISGDQISFPPASPSRDGKARIISAEYSTDEMIIHFLLTQDSVDYGVSADMPKKAILKMSETDKFKITAIADDYSMVSTESNDTASVSEDENALVNVESLEAEHMQEESLNDNTIQVEESDSANTMVASADIASAYSAILDTIQSGNVVLLPADDVNKGSSKGYEYFIHDVDQDGTPELIVGELFVMNVFDSHAIRMYTAQQTDDGYVAVEIPCQPRYGDTFYVLDVLLPQDGIGLLDNIIESRGTGAASIYRHTIQNGVFEEYTETVMNYRVGDDISTFLSENPSVEWTSIDDRSALQ